MSIDVSNRYIKSEWDLSGLLTGQNSKTLKGEKYGYRTWILHLSPSTLSGKNTCPSASLGCASACLNTSGLGNCGNVKTARLNRTKFFQQDEERFMLRLKKEIESAVKNAERADLIPAFRLNGTSDIKWEKVKFGEDNKTIFEYFPDLQFYDYTKIPNRGKKPFPNYEIVYSRSEDNDRFVADAMDDGQNVAVVFGTTDTEELPKTWTGPGGLTWPVLNGDKNDLRFLGPPKRVVGLTVKGQGTKDTTGFILYGNGVLDFTKLSEYEKRAKRDPSILGQRKYGEKKYVPIQSKVSKRIAERTAELLRADGRNARIVEHKPIIAGKKRTAYAVYTPGQFQRTRKGENMRLASRSRRPMPIYVRR